jgi:DNA-directed RNA polymerase subunit RPC12/RpoP
MMIYQTNNIIKKIIGEPIMNMDMEQERKFICPNCGTDMRLSTEGAVPTYVCPDCGSTLEADEEQQYDSEGLCPNCNQPMQGSECSYCGYDLGSDFE